MSRKVLIAALVATCFVSAFFSTADAQVSFGKPQLFNSQWEFFYGDNPAANARWRTLDLPHDWSVENTLNPSLAACTGYLPGGIAWYRKTIELPADSKDKRVYIYFEGIQNRSEVYLNGKLVGKRPNGYVSFLYDLTPFLDYSGAGNVLTVRVDHSRYADSRWYNGSGIYRNVWLVVANPTHIAQWGVYAYPKNVSAKYAELAVEVTVERDLQSTKPLTVKLQLIDADNKIIASTKSKTDNKNKSLSTIKIPRPKLWNLDDPYLYTLKTTVLSHDDKVLDETEIKTGIRSLAFDPDKGFALNGNYLKIKGLCIHHDAGVLGAAVPREVWQRRLNTLKYIGCNAIRLTHNLHNPDVYDLADELGLLVMDEVFDEWEFPKRKWIQGWNVGEPGFDGTSDFFNEWGEIDLADGVRRDRNHPSVFAWSIGNEVDYPNDPYSHPVLDGGNDGFTQKSHGGYKKDAPDANRLGGIAKRLVATIKQYDTSRPVTAGLAGVAMSNETEYPYTLDITGYNYTEDRYLSDHQKYPKRVIYGSENRHDMAAWKAVRDNEHIFGQFLWTGIDYLGESGVWPARGFYSGLLDFAGFIKPRGYYRKALWSEEPTACLGTYPDFSGFGGRRGGGGRPQPPSPDAWPVWNYEEGMQINVVCYTNARRACLFLDNKEVGEMKDYDDNTGIIIWKIPYKAGKLTVKGYDASGAEICEYSIQTSGRAASIAAKVSETKASVYQIEVTLLDDNGIPSVLADNNIFCRIEGPARLLGLEAGDNTDMGNYRDNIQRAYRGRLIAYVQATAEGEIRVSFSSPYLKPATIICK
ncbi:MAG: DUF4982 domain-containing protein [Tannerella sp.]|jgi:hypothetical protein|nr:DUF4982 domain-containing protein [Tannerella sp.]